MTQAPWAAMSRGCCCTSIVNTIVIAEPYYRYVSETTGTVVEERELNGMNSLMFENTVSPAYLVLVHSALFGRRAFHSMPSDATTPIVASFPFIQCWRNYHQHIQRLCRLSEAATRRGWYFS